MELYALIGLAVITVVLYKKLTRVERPPSPIIKPFNPVRVPNGIPDPMELDEVLQCSPLKPPTPMSTSSDDFVLDPDYIK